MRIYVSSLALHKGLVVEHFEKLYPFGLLNLAITITKGGENLSNLSLTSGGIDFDFIEEGAEKGAPKYMEWYGAFGLLVTLIWLYVEILRLIAKLRNR